MLENADVLYKFDESNRFNIVDSISRSLQKVTTIESLLKCL